MKDTKKTRTVRVNANITETLHRKVLQYCQTNGCTIAGIIRKNFLTLTK